MTKKTTTAIALILITAFAISLVATPAANAHDPPWTIISYAYLTAAPNPVGVGQSVGLYMWVDTAMIGALIQKGDIPGNDIRRHDYTLTITDPNGKVTTQHWDVVSDPTSIQLYKFTPTEVGNYILVFNYAGQTYTWGSETFGANTAYTGDVFTPANANLTLTVQQTPLPSTPNPSLPTEYWTRPIFGENWNWYTIASNWLGSPYIPNAPKARYGAGMTQPYGSAPNSAHVMWTKPIQYGGVVGGNDTAVPGGMYYAGLVYNQRFINPIIIQGNLFYPEPYGNDGGGGDYVAVDLRTGQELWRINTSATGISLVPSFGYVISYDTPNQHGNLPNGLLIAATNAYPGLGTVWRGYDPRTGVLTSINVTNVPSGSAVAGPIGEYLIDSLTNLGDSANPNWYLAQWNSSKVIGTPGPRNRPINWYSGTVDASLPSCYDWNISLNLPWSSGDSPWKIATAGFTGTPLISRDNVMLLVQGTFGGHVSDLGAVVTPYPANITAISLKPNTLGQVLWTQSYPQAPNNNTRYLTCWDPTNGVFIFYDKESFAHWGYSVATGNLLWGPVYPPSGISDVWNYQLLGENTAYGNLYMTGYTGLLYCWNITTGDLQWTFGNGGEGNNTRAPVELPFNYVPMFLGTFADGMVYLLSSEHSADSPLYHGYLLHCVNATTGTQLWAISNFGNGGDGFTGGYVPVASGYLVADNCYDLQLYCYGRGPSATTVSAPDVAAAFGTPVVIKGTVLDISAGTTQNEQAARFPNGVPAVSDESMSAWMEYVYQQKPRPADAVGVNVTLSVLDSNDNCYEIGTATSDANGFFHYTWTPIISGDFTVYATFAGSEGYWPSQAETAFTVMEPAEATPPPEATPAPATDMYVTGFGIAIIIAIVAVGLVLVLMLRKR